MTGTLLVTALGTNPKPARYELELRSAEATLAPLALVTLLPEARRPSRVLALCTTDAKAQSWPLLEQGLAGTGIGAEALLLGDDPTDVAAFLRVITQAIPVDSPPAGLMIDATHGFRHHAVLTYLTFQYLAALRGIELQGAFYGLWRPVEQGSSPFLDLRALLELPEWIHALRVFRHTGDASLLAQRIATLPEPAARDMARELRQISEAREAGLPLELGQLSASFRATRKKPFRKALEARGALLGDELWRQLDAALARYGFPARYESSNWKPGVQLTHDELGRQARLIDDLLERGSLAVALGLMNEWVVSRVALQLERQYQWLDYESTRRNAASALGTLVRLNEGDKLRERLTDEQRKLARFWSTLSDLRNSFHHHGMRKQVLVGAGAHDVESRLDAVKELWAKFKALDELPLSPPCTIERLLVSAVGRKPGVLFSAIHACRREGLDPDACLLLVSDETAAAADEALRQAGFGGKALPALRISDPYGGQSEIEKLVREARPSLLSAREVLVNLTGGTTLMGLAVSKIADEAKALGRHVRRFGLVDRRPDAEQEADPYRASEAFWLDAPGAHGD